MALPKLNENPKYDLIIPSTKQKVKFRPYLVKEEKVLLIATESRDVKSGVTAIVDTLKAVIDEDIDVSSLTLFDIEYMFTMVRSKSVGESADLVGTCEECQEKTEINVNLDDIKIPIIKEKNIIKLTNEVSVEMRYPSWVTTVNNEFVFDDNVPEIEKILHLVLDSMYAIMTDEEKIIVKDEPRESILTFVESMTVEQYNKLKEFLESTPVVEKDIIFNCSKCNHKNELTIRNIADFF